MLETDFSLLVGLSVALTVFLIVTVTSIRILRKKGRSPSMYTMTNLNYRREFCDKKDDGTTNVSTATSSKVETKFGNVISRGRVGNSSTTNTVDILNGVVGGQNGTIGFEVDIVDGSEKKTPATLAKFGGYDVVLAASAANSISGSPFVDKKMNGKAKLFGGIATSGVGTGSKALLLFGNAAASPATSIRSGGLLLETVNSASSPRMMPKTASSPTCSEHQYDIPFGHLSRVQHQPSHRRLPSDEPDYDEMETTQKRASNNADDVKRTSNHNVGVDPMNNVWASSSSARIDSTLLQPRLIDASTGNTPLLGRWSPSDKSINTSIYSESDRPLSSLFGGEAGMASASHMTSDVTHYGGHVTTNDIPSYRQSLSSCSLDPDSFTFASVGCAGAIVTLQDLGVTLTIPEGALDRGYTEEIFLAVMTEGRDRPRLSDNQTLLSPVVLAGPPRLTFRKPVVISFGHCADLTSLSAWEMGVYHCDSLFSEGDDTPWVKLSSVGESFPVTSTLSSQSSSSSSSASSKASSSRKTSPSTLVHLERDVCYIMTDFLSRFCIVGQSAAPPSTGLNPNTSACPASKVLRIIVFGKPVSTSLDFSLVIQVTDNTATAVESVMRIADKQGFGLIQDSVEEKKIFHFFDSSDVDGDLHLSIADCSTGWSLRPKTQQTLQFSQVWSGGSLRANYNLHHVDPTVQSIAFKLTAIQGSYPNELARSTFGIHVDVTARLPSPLDHNLKFGSGSSSGSAADKSGFRTGFKLPPGLKNRLCRMLDSPQTKGLNDWRALSAALRFEKFSNFFASKSSPTDSILTLWESIQQNNPMEGSLRMTSSANILIKETLNPLSELLNLLRLIGREDVALMIEKDFSPWI